VDRLACVDLAAFPLQLLCHRHPEWQGYPVAVVAEDKPNGIILWVNDRARAARILPGQRYAHGLSLSRELRAAVVPQRHIDDAVDRVTALLRDFSPEVEPCGDEPGVLWLDASGLQRVFRSQNSWAKKIAARLRGEKLAATVVVGFTRFATYAVARARPGGVTVFERLADEREAARRVTLDRLDLEPKLRDLLAKLGVTTLGAFMRLPPGGLLIRFGKQALRLHQLAAGERWDPLQPKAASEPLETLIYLDDPETNAERLVFAIKRGLDPLLSRLAANHAALAALFLQFRLDRQAPDKVLEIIRPAEPSLDMRSLLRLVHLRLESSPPPAGVTEILLSVEDVAATLEQLSLFAQQPKRDLHAGAEAFARLRAEYGNDAVVRATLREGHLPEARYGWEPMEKPVLPFGGKPPQTPPPATLIRRVRPRPRMLPPQNHQVRDDGWLLQGLEAGPIARIVGPYIISGGWWRKAIHREYHFAQTKRGEWLWVYFDRGRRRWFLHGRVQ